MRVAGDNHRIAEGRWIHRNGEPLVHEEEPPASDFQLQVLRQVVPQRSPVVVASDRQDRSDVREGRENVLPADVSRVENQGASGQGRESFTSDEPVGVRDDSDQGPGRRTDRTWYRRQEGPACTKNARTPATTVSTSSSVSEGKIGSDRLVRASASDSGRDGGGPKGAIAGWRWFGIG